MSAAGHRGEARARARRSAGVLLYRFRDGVPQVLLVHPGGPFWQRKDEGAWSLPKGEFEEGETPEAVARRELLEETGFALDAPLTPLAPVRQRGGKTIHAFAAEADFDASTMRSNTFAMEWPPRSGRVESFPEVDRAAWFDLDVAAAKLLASQRPILDELAQRLLKP
ncbi:MAG TPA: NUDIX domain-containing protein [Casimicrobiaceae bacterium]|nr:NUDIX domain-containing protein [Casimicrobiaceae bacterium]